MTLTNPPYALQGGTHGAQLFREAISSLLAPAGGLVLSGDLKLTQNGTPNMSVNVAAGRCWIPGTSLGLGLAWYPQGLYFAENDAAVNLAISAASASKPRVDTVICQIQDTFYAGGVNSASLAVLTGTPTTGATLGNLSGAAAVPVSSLVLGYVLVPVSTTSIITADISNVASVGAIGMTSGLSFAPAPGAWSALTLASGLSAATGYYVPSARLENASTVRLKGALKNTSGGTIAAGTTLATIPAAMRPTVTLALAGTFPLTQLIVFMALTPAGLLTSGGDLLSTAVLDLDGITYTLA